MNAIYMDYAATTPVDPRVAQAMMECLTLEGCFGNPSSTGHSFGSQARARVEKARQQVAALLKCEPTAIVWTSGATESNNLSILGAARYNARTGGDSAGHIVTSRTEHKAVLDPCKQLEKEGFRVTCLRPDAQGIVSPAQVAEALAPDTLLVSLMHVNNEIGVIQDIAAIGRLCRERAVLFHVDAAQSAGKLPIDVGAMNVDLLSLTAHKFYGPKGAGALYVRRKPRVGLAPLMFGGGQESGLRSGTLATHQIVGLGAAAALAAAEMDSDAQRLAGLRRAPVGGARVARRRQSQQPPRSVDPARAERVLRGSGGRKPAVRPERSRCLDRLRLQLGDAGSVLCTTRSRPLRCARAGVPALQHGPLHARCRRGSRRRLRERADSAPARAQPWLRRNR